MIRPPPISTLFPSPPLSRPPAQPTILTRPRDPSQGGLLLEDTPQVRRHAEEKLIAPRRAQTDDPAPVHHQPLGVTTDRKSTRLNSSHSQISYAVFCLKKKKK